MSTPQGPPPAWGPPQAWRTLTIELRKTPMMLTKPHVRVDQQHGKARWGRFEVPVPADRPCVVQAYMPFLGGGSGTATGSWRLEPHHPPFLEYSAPYNAWFDGELGPPGTTHHKGKGPAIALVVVAVLVVLVLVGLPILGAALG